MKLKVLVLCGGPSAEHPISLISAQNVLNALKKADKYEISVVGITKDSRWLSLNSDDFLENRDNPDLIRLKSSDNLFDINKIFSNSNEFDVVFPVLHGPFGEDGSVQGLLRCAGIPFVGSSVAGSALSMDKVHTKRILNQIGIPQAKYEVIYRNQFESYPLESLFEKLGDTIFVKPANMGSSIGVSRVTDMSSLNRGLKEAFKYDRKVILEATLKGKEVECAVLGNYLPEASSSLGEIEINNDFYSYTAKYIDNTIAKLSIPSKVSENAKAKIREYSLRSFLALDCLGLARIDFFVDGEKIYLNELNTMPGFTSISMYPKLWEHSGIPVEVLVEKLINFAFEVHESTS